MVKILLKEQSINVNQQNIFSNTALFCTCRWGHDNIVELLVKNNRVDTSKINNYDHTLLWHACRFKNIETIKILISSDRNLINVKQKANNKYWNPTASEIARIEGHIEISCAELVEAYINNPKKIIDEIRKELNWTEFCMKLNC